MIVPGCNGDADTVGDGFDDFCIRPQTNDTLVIAGDEGFPADAFPLQACQGDCDEDADCDEGRLLPGRCLRTSSPSNVEALRT